MTHPQGNVLDGPLFREYRAMSARVGERREQLDRLRAVIDELEEQTAREEHLLREMAGALGDHLLTESDKGGDDVAQG